MDGQPDDTIRRRPFAPLFLEQNHLASAGQWALAELEKQWLLLYVTVTNTPHIDYSFSHFNDSTGSDYYQGVDLSLPIRYERMNYWQGNPSLRTSRNHNLWGYYREKLRRTLVNATLNINVMQDAVAWGTLYNLQNGKRITMPQNVNGNWNSSLSAGVDFPIVRDERLRLKQDIRHRYNHALSTFYQRTRGLSDAQCL
jgi:hypothetical protein